MAINTADALRETQETIAAVNDYISRVETKDAEQEASIASLKAKVAELEAAQEDPAVIAALASIQADLDNLQRRVEPPVVPEPPVEEPPVEGAPTEG